MRDQRIYTTSAIVLKRTNYSEADRILTLFSPQIGKLTVIAKGVRKPTSKRKSHIELLSQIQAQIVKGKTWDILAEVTPIVNFPIIRQDLHRIMHAYHLLEVVDKLLPDQQAYPEIYEWLIKALQHLEEPTPNLLNLHRSFKLRLLQTLGYWPEDEYPPADIDQYLESILERPLKTSEFLGNYQLNTTP